MRIIEPIFTGFVASASTAVLLGIAASIVFPATYLLLLFIIPISLLIGSIFAGYSSYYEIENKWMLLWLPPTLYVNLLFVCASFGMSLLNRYLDTFTYSNNADNAGSFFMPWQLVLFGLFWYLMSLAGVGLGYFIRSLFVNWWYKDDELREQKRHELETQINDDLH